jgi:hypothetical protein
LTLDRLETAERRFQECLASSIFSLRVASAKNVTELVIVVPTAGTTEAFFGFVMEESWCRGKVGSLPLALHFSSARRSCWNVEIAEAISKGGGKGGKPGVGFPCFPLAVISTALLRSLNKEDAVIGVFAGSKTALAPRFASGSAKIPRSFRSHHNGHRLGPAGGDVHQDKALWSVVFSARDELGV